MKRITLILIGLMACISAFAQSQFPSANVRPVTNEQEKITKLFWLNTSDTTDYDAVNYPGAIIFQKITGDTALYYSDGVKWVPLGSSSDLSNYIAKADSTEYGTPTWIDSIARAIAGDTLRYAISVDTSLAGRSNDSIPSQAAVEGAFRNYQFQNFNFFGGGSIDPILTFSSSDSAWQNQVRELGNVIRSGDSLVMVYSGFPAGTYVENNVHAGLAYSSDEGKTWTKRQDTLITRASEDPYIVYHGGTYYLYCEDKKPNPATSIRLYTSSDLTNWTDKGVILNPTATGWEDYDVSSPTVYIRNDTFYMFYEGRDFADQQYGAIGLAYSLDGINFTRYSDQPLAGYDWFPDSLNTVKWAVSGIVPDDMIKIGGTYYMTIHAQMDDGWYGGMIYSTDMIHWRDKIGYAIGREQTNIGGEGAMYYWNDETKQYGFVYADGHKALYIGYPGISSIPLSVNSATKDWANESFLPFSYQNTDLDTLFNLKKTMFFYGPTDSLIGGVSTAKVWHGLFISHGGTPGYGTELAMRNNQIFIRSIEAGSIKPWIELANTNNIASMIHDSTVANISRVAGNATFSGDGTTNAFSAAISPGFTPTKIIITPTSVDAAKAVFYTSYVSSATFVVTVTGTTPPSGTGNVTFDYELIK